MADCFLKNTIANFRPTVISLTVPTSNLINRTASDIGNYIESLINFGELFQALQILEGPAKFSVKSQLSTVCQKNSNSSYIGLRKNCNEKGSSCRFEIFLGK